LITSASTAANWPELEKVMKASPDVRFIFKEWPIFALGELRESSAARPGCLEAKRGGRVYGLSGVVSENGIYGHSRFCNTDFDDKLACLNLSGV
jgi:hypothetical protein